MQIDERTQATQITLANVNEILSFAIRRDCIPFEKTDFEKNAP